MRDRAGIPAPLQTVSETRASRRAGASRPAEWFVQNAVPAQIGTVGLTDRLLSHLDDLAQNAASRRDRRTATKFARLLRSQPVGWPLES